MKTSLSYFISTFYFYRIHLPCSHCPLLYIVLHVSTHVFLLLTFNKFYLLFVIPNNHLSQMTLRVFYAFKGQKRKKKAIWFISSSFYIFVCLIICFFVFKLVSLCVAPAWLHPGGFWKCQVLSMEHTTGCLLSTV